MFAPWCPTCSARMLLGPRRVEAVEAGPHGPRVILRCHCGTALVWSAEAERVERAARIEPDGVGGTVPLAVAAAAGSTIGVGAADRSS